MFSPSFKRALVRISVRHPSRFLTTTSLPTSNAPPILLEEERSQVTGRIKDLENQNQSILTSTPRYSIEPVYIQLSSLLREVPAGTSPMVAALAPSVFRHPIRRDVLHLCVVHHLDGLRQGTAANKSRGEVKGSGRKIRPQKGSGKARLGDAQSPMLRGGGRAFAKKARDFSTQLPRKVIDMGMRVALSAKVKENTLGVVESLNWPGVKTKDLSQRLKELGWYKTLFVTGLESVPETLERSSRNIQGVDTATVWDLSVYDAVKWERLVLDLPAVEFFEAILGKTEVDILAEDITE